MGLLDDIKQEAELKPGPSCGAGKLLTDPDIGPDLQQALDERMAFEAIARALRKMGRDIKAGTLSRHASGRCSCG